MKNKTRIKLTWVNDLHPMYMEKVLWLRTARKIGDEETVNQTVLGKIKACIDLKFIIIP